MRRALGALALLLLAASSAPAQETGACGKFAWPITQEQNLFNAPGLAQLHSGETLKLSSALAAAVRLKK